MPSYTTLPLQDYIAEQTDIAISYNTLSAKFGDGYEQTSDNGINTKQKTWTVTYTAMNETQSQTVLDFLDTVRGSVPFYATPRGETQQVWRLIPDSLRLNHIAVSNLDGKVYRTIQFQLKKAYT